MPSIVSRQFQFDHGLDQIDSQPTPGTQLPARVPWDRSPDTVPSQTEKLWPLPIKEDSVLSSICGQAQRQLGNPSPDWFHSQLGTVADELAKMRREVVAPEAMRVVDAAQTVIQRQADLDNVAWDARQALLTG